MPLSCKPSVFCHNLPSHRLALHLTALQQPVIWGYLCFSVHSHETLDAYSILVNLIPRIVWLGRTVEQRYK